MLSLTSHRKLTILQFLKLGGNVVCQLYLNKAENTTPKKSELETGTEGTLGGITEDNEILCSGKKRNLQVSPRSWM